LALVLAAAIRIALNATTEHSDSPIFPPPIFATRHITLLREENSRALIRWDALIVCLLHSVARAPTDRHWRERNT
jgi:hypothetical protein